jgi:HSP20 family protein
LVFDCQSRGRKEEKKMTSLIRWRPSPELIPWRPSGALWDRDFEDFFDDFAEPFWMETENGGHWLPRVESYQKNGNYVIKADLPGVKAKDIHVAVEGDRLLIQGERKRDRETKGKDFRRKEVFYGAFQRSVPIPRGLKVDEIKAKYHDGVLEITAPVEKIHSPEEVRIEVEKTA